MCFFLGKRLDGILRREGPKNPWALRGHCPLSGPCPGPLFVPTKIN